MQEKDFSKFGQYKRIIEQDLNDESITEIQDGDLEPVEEETGKFVSDDKTRTAIKLRKAPKLDSMSPEEVQERYKIHYKFENLKEAQDALKELEKEVQERGQTRGLKNDISMPWQEYKARLLAIRQATSEVEGGENTQVRRISQIEQPEMIEKETIKCEAAYLIEGSSRKKVVEDNAEVNQDNGSGVAADGLGAGGEQKGTGSVASLVATRVIDSILQRVGGKEEDMKEAFEVAHRAIMQLQGTGHQRALEVLGKNFGMVEQELEIVRGMGPDFLKGMKTTASAIKVFREGEELKVIIGHVGDTRIYEFNGKELSQVTEDHDPLYEAIHQGIITREDVKNNKRLAECSALINLIYGKKLEELTDEEKSRISNYFKRSSFDEVTLQDINKGGVLKALGATEKGKMTPDIFVKDTQPGSEFLLCSDGLVKNLNDEEIKQVISEDLPAREKAKKLVSLAKSKVPTHQDEWYDDDITAVILKVPVEELDLEGAEEVKEAA